MRLSFVPLIAALLPATALHVCYLLAAQQGHVPWCFPYIDGCTSISATGRQGPEAYVFRALIIPTAVCLVVYWRLSHAWIESLGGAMRHCNRLMLYLGIIAALGLVWYTTVLGSIGQVYFVQRRTGVTTFYVLTVAAQLLMTAQIAVIARRQQNILSRMTRGMLAACCSAILVLGAISLALSVTFDDYGSIDDAFEWTITLFVLGHVFATYFAWKESGFHAHFKVAGR